MVMPDGPKEYEYYVELHSFVEKIRAIQEGEQVKYKNTCILNSFTFKPCFTHHNFHFLKFSCTTIVSFCRIKRIFKEHLFSQNFSTPFFSSYM